MASDFGDQVKRFNRKYEARQTAIFRASAQEVMDIANVPVAQGGKMPVDTAFLRNSVAASTAGLPRAGSAPSLVFSTMKVGQTVHVGWTAEYALRMEYGFMGADSLGRNYSQRGFGYLRSAVQQWPKIVADVTGEVMTRIP